MTFIYKTGMMIKRIKCVNIGKYLRAMPGTVIAPLAPDTTIPSLVGFYKFTLAK